MTLSSEEIEYLKQLSEENKSTQKMLSDIRNMLSQIVKDSKKPKKYLEVGYRG